MNGETALLDLSIKETELLFILGMSHYLRYIS